AKRGLAHRQHVLVRRSVRRVALHAIFRDRRVLERERPLILGMAAETKFVGIGHLEIVARAAAVGIVTIHAAHLAFANGVMVGQITFGILLLVAAEAVLISLASRFNRSRSAVGLALELAAGLAMSLAMDRVAVGALDVLRLMRTREPVPHVIRLGVATQARAVGFLRRTILKADDLVFRLLRVPARSYV